VTPNFSGFWQLNLETSTLRGQAPTELFVKIDHREPTLVQTMRIVAANGEEQHLRFTYVTDGRAVANATPSASGESRAYWNGAELVIETVLNTPARTFRFKDHWSLSDNGSTLRMAHVDDDLAGQVAVLEKAAPEVAARFTSE
jgi:hypothetical protein